VGGKKILAGGQAPPVIAWRNNRVLCPRPIWKSRDCGAFAAIPRYAAVAA